MNQGALVVALLLHFFYVLSLDVFCFLIPEAKILSSIVKSHLLIFYKESGFQHLVSWWFCIEIDFFLVILHWDLFFVSFSYSMLCWLKFSIFFNVIYIEFGRMVKWYLQGLQFIILIAFITSNANIIQVTLY